MRIQLITHTTSENTDRLTGRWSILPYFFRKLRVDVDHITRNEWFNWPKRYRQFKPDAIITSGPVGAIISFLKRIGLIKIKIFHDWNDNYVEVMGGKWGKYLIKILEDYSIRNSDIIISCSYYRMERSIKEFNKVENKDLFYIPHGIHSEYYKKIKDISLPGKNKTKVIYVGEQSKLKRVDKLIMAFKNIKADLILIGKTNEEFKKQSIKNVYFLGKIAAKDVPSYLFSSDFLIITEDNDSALKLMEYLATNKPILIPKGRISRYFKYENLMVYSDLRKITKLIKYKKRYKKINVSSWNQIADKYLNMILHHSDNESSS